MNGAMAAWWVFESEYSHSFTNENLILASQLAAEMWRIMRGKS